MFQNDLFDLVQLSCGKAIIDGEANRVEPKLGLIFRFILSFYRTYTDRKLVCPFPFVAA
jgi:hypothetical protein